MTLPLSFSSLVLPCGDVGQRVISRQEGTDDSHTLLESP